MAYLTVYRASAGSGKTFRLTVEYLKLLIANPEAYANILAVTFTNKATGEMKGRIVSDLYGIAHDCSPGVLENVVKELGVSESYVKEQARKAINYLLHDYSRFRIETIDSFFQSVLRSLARELGMNAYLNIEMDNQKVMNDAVERIIEATRDNQELLQWIGEYIEEKIAEGKSWRVEREIASFGQSIFLEIFQANEALLQQKLENKEFIREFRNQLRTLIGKFKEKMLKKASEFFYALESNGLAVEDLSFKNAGPAGYFIKLRNLEFDDSVFGVRAAQAATIPEKWTSKSSPRFAEIKALAEQILSPLLNETEEMRRSEVTSYNSAILSLKHINSIGLLTDLSNEVKELNRENNRFLLADTTAMLRKMIGDADASFVYEKMGVQLQHIMIDEFQDTSRMQWENFLPLLSEGLAQGKESLIVGDEKQSIYRWRNGDWRILNGLEKENRITGGVQSMPLSTNWRSLRNVVEFNNDFFTAAVEVMQATYNDEYGVECDDLAHAYATKEQRPSKEAKEGFVEVLFLDKPERKKKKGEEVEVEEAEIVSEDPHLDMLLEKVEQLQASGVKPQDIAILVRVNKVVPDIASFFAEVERDPMRCKPNTCYKIVSDDAFRLDASPAIRILMNAARYVCDNQNPIFRTQLIIDWIDDVCGNSERMEEILRNPELVEQELPKLLPEHFVERLEALYLMPLGELFEELYRLFELNRIEKQEGYLFAFFDRIAEFMSDKGSDLRAFIEFWDDTLYRKTVSAGSDIEGIRILTIHKSKGLEFHSVIIPYCNWKLVSRLTDDVWCVPQNEPFNQMPLLPISFGEQMKNSFFTSEHREELLQLWTDNLNLLYVGFTRAESNLIILCDKKKETAKNISASPTTASDLVRIALRLNKMKPDEQFYTCGEWVKTHEKKSTKIEQNIFKQSAEPTAIPFVSFAGNSKFRQSNQSKQFITDGTTPLPFTRFIDRGKLLHELFSRIRTTQEVERAIRSMLNEGLISIGEQQELSDYVTKALQHPKVAHWYSGKYRLYNECTILFSKKGEKAVQQRRPDRVMQDGAKMIVVDFKFGKPNDKYNDQVRGYIRLLNEMGYQDIEGYLWYVDMETIVNVDTVDRQLTLFDLMEE